MSTTAVPKFSLTPRQIEILQLLANGKTDSEVAAALKLECGSIKSHMRRIFERLEVNNRTKAVVIAWRLRLIH